MIEATVSALLQTLAGPRAAEFSLLRGLEAEMRILRHDLVAIEAVLEEAEEKKHMYVRILRHDLVANEAVLEEAEEKKHMYVLVWTWLRHLGDVAYDAADVFDDLNMEAALHPGLLIKRDAGVIVPSVWLVSARILSHYFAHTPIPVLFCHRMERRVKDIVARLSDIMEIKRGLMLGLTGERESPGVSGINKTTSLKDDQLVVFGRGEEKQQLVEKLCAPDDCVPRLVSIVGMGGIGKTTLAMVVYNDDMVKGHFRVRKWVSVGEKFVASRIIEGLLSEADRQKIANKNPSLEVLRGHLRREIKDKKFLIVLDNVWSEKPEEWDQVWRPLACGAKGAKVLVTTRSKEVAGMMGPAPFSLKMEPLTDDDCWLIFEKCAFVGGSSMRYPVLEEIGMEIVKKIKGHPLVAKLIGGALRRNFTEIYWRRLRDSDVWLQNLNGGLLPSLLLSYRALPSYLKTCFQFCSLFPKDHKFDREILVWMWMAHDFIQPVRGRRMEDVGSHYFDQLLRRSFFQYINDTYVMHDLIHDLAQFVSKDECLRVDEKMQSCSRLDRIHHLSLYCEEYKLDPREFYHFNRIRTLILDSHSSLSVMSDHVFCGLLGGVRCICVLDRNGLESHSSLLKCISYLKHLRYLDLLNTLTNQLPESLCTLYNLQTLRVPSDCRLPKGMSKLVNLRNLDAGQDYISKIDGVGNLTCLQELKGPFVVSNKEGHRIGELKTMNQLRGMLRLQNLENVSSMEEAKGVQLKDKVLLHRLELHWHGNNAFDYSSECMIEALQPPLELKEMKLENHPGSQPPSWMMLNQLLLANLVALELSGCKEWTCLPTGLGRLPCLRSLMIKGMHGVKRIGPEFLCCGSDSDIVSFPTLEELLFREMDGWETWVRGGAAEEETEDSNALSGQEKEQWHGQCHQSQQCFCFPQLRKLEIKKCPKLATTSGFLQYHSLEALQHLVIWDCEELVQVLGDDKEGGKLNLHCLPRRMLEILDIVNCPRLVWSELKALLLLSSSSLMALRICRFGPSSYKVRMRV